MYVRTYDVNFISVCSCCSPRVQTVEEFHNIFGPELKAVTGDPDRIDRVLDRVDHLIVPITEVRTYVHYCVRTYIHLCFVLLRTYVHTVGTYAQCGISITQKAYLTTCVPTYALYIRMHLPRLLLFTDGSEPYCTYSPMYVCTYVFLHLAD